MDPGSATSASGAPPATADTSQRSSNPRRSPPRTSFPRSGATSWPAPRLGSAPRDVRRSGRSRWPAVATAVISPLIVVAVATVVVSLRPSSPAKPRAGTSASGLVALRGPSEGAAPTSYVIRGSDKLLAVAPDPAGGRAWGIREVRTSRHQVCLSAGRVNGGSIGAICPPFGSPSHSAGRPLTVVGLLNLEGRSRGCPRAKSQQQQDGLRATRAPQSDWTTSADNDEPRCLT